MSSVDRAPTDGTGPASAEAAADAPSIAEFERAGLYDPEIDADTGRLELLQWLHEQGLTIQEMVAAKEEMALGATVGDRRLVPGPRMTRAEAIERSGLDPDRFDALVTAFGFTPIQSSPEGEIGFIDAEVEAFTNFSALSSMFTEEDALGFMRVVGSAMSRVAEAGVSLFLADVESPTLLSGASELQLALQVYDAVGLIDGFAAELDPILRRHLLQATERTRRTTIDESERFQYRYAIGFVDLVGFTALSGTMPAPELAGFLRDFEAKAHDLANQAGAQIVKLIGDEVMFVATDAADACRAGQALMDGFDEGTVVPRGGMAYGDVLLRSGDYFGPVVNLAARLVAEAVPGEMLVTEELVAAATGCDFAPAGRRMVKGFDEPVPVRTLVRP